MSDGIEVRRILPEGGILIDGYLFKDVLDVPREIHDAFHEDVLEWREDNAELWASILSTTKQFAKPNYIWTSQIYVFLNEKLIVVIYHNKPEDFPDKEYVGSHQPTRKFIGSKECATAQALWANYVFENNIVDVMHNFAVFDLKGNDLIWSCRFSLGASVAMSHRIPGKIVGIDAENNKVLAKIVTKKSAWTKNRFENYLESWVSPTSTDVVTLYEEE